MTETGTVLEIRGKGIVAVFVERTEACAKCRACAAGFSKKGMTITASLENAEEAKVGDIVALDMPEGVFLGAAALMYGLPAAMFVVGCIAGYAVFTRMLEPVGASLAAFAVGMALVGAAYRVAGMFSAKRAERYTPKARLL